jgi:hypothetical protein
MPAKGRSSKKQVSSLAGTSGARKRNQKVLQLAQRGVMNLIFETVSNGSNIRLVRPPGVKLLKQQLLETGYETSSVIKVYEDMEHCKANGLTPLIDIWISQQPSDWASRPAPQLTMLDITLEDLSKRKLKGIDGMHRCGAMVAILQDEMRENGTPNATFEQKSKSQWYSVPCGWLYDQTKLAGALINLLADRANQMNDIYVETTYIDRITAMQRNVPYYMEWMKNEHARQVAAAKVC